MKILITLFLLSGIIGNSFAKCELNLSNSKPQANENIKLTYQADDRFSSLNSLYAIVNFYSEIDKQSTSQIVKINYEKQERKLIGNFTIPNSTVFITISTFEYYPALDSILQFPIKEQIDNNNGLEYSFMVYEQGKPKKLANYFAMKQVLKGNTALSANYKLAKNFLNDEKSSYPSSLLNLYDEVIDANINIGNELACNYEKLYNTLVNTDSLDLEVVNELEFIKSKTLELAPKKLLDYNKYNYYSQSKKIMNLLTDKKVISDSILLSKSILDFPNADEFLEYVFEMPTDSKNDLDFIINLIDNYYSDKLKFETKFNLLQKAISIDDYLNPTNLKDKIKTEELAKKIIELHSKFVADNKSNYSNIEYINLFDDLVVLDNDIFALKNINYEKNNNSHLVAQELVQRLLSAKKIQNTFAFQLFLKLRETYIAKFGEDKNYKLLMQKIYYLVERNRDDMNNYFDKDTQDDIAESLKSNNTYKINLDAADEGFEYTLVNDMDLLANSDLKTVKDTLPNFTNSSYKLIFYKKASGNFKEFKELIEELQYYFKSITKTKNIELKIYPMLNAVGNETMFEKMKKIKEFDEIESQTLFCFDKNLNASINKDDNDNFYVILLNKQNKVKYIFSKFANFESMAVPNFANDLIKSQIGISIFNYFSKIDKFD